MTRDELLAEAQKRISAIPKNTKFLLKDLFTGIEWKAIPTKTRCDMGALFLNYAKNNKNIVSIAEKTSSNQQQYVKV